MTDLSVYHVLYLSSAVIGLLYYLVALYLHRVRGMHWRDSMLKVSPLVGAPALIIGFWYRDLLFWGGVYLFLVIFVRLSLLALFREQDAAQQWWRRRKQKAQQKANEDT